jgi:hypothetical protein
MLFLLNCLLYVHFAAFLVYLATLLRQWDHSVKRTTHWMLYCGITLLLTGAGLIAVRYPEINYVKVVPKSALFMLIAGITGAYRGKALSRLTWRWLLGLTVLTAFIALWRMA